MIDQKLQMIIGGQNLNRDSKCLIQIQQQNNQKVQFGCFEFEIMNYKNYSKNSFKIMANGKIIGTIHIIISISSSIHRKVNFQTSRSPLQQTNSKSTAKKNKQEQISYPQINICIPTDIKLVCPSEAISEKEPKSMFNAFQNSGIVIHTKKDINGHPKNNQKKPLSSMGELLQKNIKVDDGTLKIPQQQNLAKSCKLSPNKGIKDSRYCKQIQQNLDNLNALDEQSNRLTYSKSPFKNDDTQLSIFDTLHRMKDKFEKIHQKQGILDSSVALDELAQVNQEGETEQRQYLMVPNEKNYDLNSVQSEHLPSQLGKSTVINLLVNSHIGSSNESDQQNMKLKITKAIDFIYAPRKSTFKINNCVNFNFIGSMSQQVIRPTHQKRYLLAKPNIVSDFKIEKQQEPEVSKNMGQSYLNFQIQQQSLKRVSYIKLNKISHLSLAADVAKRRNNFLIKANEQLKNCKNLAEHKLQISKKIISEKEDLLNHEFQTLRQHMKIITNNLNLKNQQSQKRQQKIKSLQSLVQQYVRDINCLKNELKVSFSTIKDLKCLLSFRQEKDLIQSRKTQILGQVAGTKQKIVKFHQNQDYEKMTIFTPLIENDGQKSLTSRTFIPDKRVRKNSSIQNIFNRQVSFQYFDKSADLCQKGFRKFSHSKNSPLNGGCSQQSKKVNSNSKLDEVFEKLSGLFSGQSGNNRLLQNL